MIEKIAARLHELLLRGLVGLRWMLARKTLTTTTAKSEPALIVSLTSHPPRYGTLCLTLKCLLLQKHKADAVVLWLSLGDRDALPASIIALQAFGLQIRECTNFRSYNKLIPSLHAFPDATVVICDDDTYYWPTWLGELVAEAGMSKGKIICHRTHLIELLPAGVPASYLNWEHNAADRSPSPLMFPTGVGGVLIPPGALDPMVLDTTTAKVICPTADDVWIYWMGRRAGTLFQKIGPTRDFVSWRSSQDVALWRENNIGEVANDRQITAMIAHFGSDGIFE